MLWTFYVHFPQLLSLASLQRSYNVGRMADKLSFNGKPIPSDSPTTVSNTGLETYLTGNLTSLVNSSCYLSICRHIDKPPLSLRGRHSEIGERGFWAWEKC